MPGEKGPHHTDQFKKCVADVQAEGKDESAAYAICTVSLKKAGHPIFVGAEAGSEDEVRMLAEQQMQLLADAAREDDPESRELILRGATGAVQYKKLHGRDHMVIPVVALVEGVIHASNASSAEYVPITTIKQAAASFNGRPITVGHPVRGGQSTSANAPDIHESYAIGTVFNARVEGKKLLCDAWVDVDKAKAIDRELYDRLSAGRTNEVSVGALVIANHQTGNFGGKEYSGTWMDASGDHLAFLPRGNGACSVAMGCGTHRTAMRHLITAEGIESDPVASMTAMMRSLMPRGWGDDEVKKDIADALYVIETSVRNGEILRFTNNSILYCIYPSLNETMLPYGPPPKIQYYQRGYSFDTTAQKFVIDANRQEVEPTTVYQPVRTASAPQKIASPRVIKLEGGKYVLYSRDNNAFKLGEHSTRSLAEEHDRAIDAALARQTTSPSCSCGGHAANEGE